MAPLPYLPLPDASAPPQGVDAAAGRDAAVDDPATLPQTRDRPHEGAQLDARAHALWDAIARDDPDAGLPFFFPLPAYRQVKAIPNPDADWKHRLVAAYKRDIHRLREKLGSHAADARFLELEVPHERARWVEPGNEGNKLGYWRVYGSRLHYETDRGPGTLEVSSLISWRGEWYVVHLSGFK